MILIIVLLTVALALSYVQYRIWLANKFHTYGQNPQVTSWLRGHAARPGHLREFLEQSFFSKAHYVRVFFLSILHISEDKLVKAILNDDLGYEKGLVYRPYKLWFKEGLTPAEGEKGRALRKQIAPAFSKARQQIYVPTFNRVATGMNQRWIKNMKNTKEWFEVDAFEDTRLLTIDAICESCGVKDLNGKRISTLTNSSQDLLSAFFYIWNEASQQRLISSKNQFVSLFSKYLTPKGKLFAQHVSYLQRITEEAIAHRKKEISEGQRNPGENERDFLDHFIERDLTEEQTRDMMINFMFAATDTVALSISWTLVLLAKYPNWQNVIYEELKEEEGERFSSSNYPYETKNSKSGYLVACLNEAMRLFPPVPFLSRHTKSHATFEVEDHGQKQFDVAKDQEILVSFWGLHRDESKWEKPNEFDPLRFYSPTSSNENCSSTSPRNDKGSTFCPFSVGRRNCIGQTYAMTEAIVVLGRIIKQFHLSVHESFEPSTHPLLFTTSLQPAEKIMLRLKSRVEAQICNA